MRNPTLPSPLTDLYEEDETAWLEEMSRLIAERRFEDLDTVHLSEFLCNMDRRDKREALSRLTTLLVHLLKWEHQPQQRTKCWAAVIASQRAELSDLLESKTLLAHAREVLATAYSRAAKQVAIETGLSGFLRTCPYSIEWFLGGEDLG